MSGGVSEVKPSGATAPEIHWFKLDVSNPASPTVVLQGDISGASIGTGVAVFTPSIAVDQNGDMLINFSASGPNMYPSDYYTVLGAGDSAFSTPTLYKASDTFFNSGTLNDQRWGTYSTAVADPNNANGFWLSSEYISTAVNGPGGTPGWWDTNVTQIQVGSSTPPGQAPTITGTVAGQKTTSEVVPDKLNDDTQLTRAQCAEALTAHGWPTTRSTLEQVAYAKKGPPYIIWRNRSLYLWGNARRWAESLAEPRGGEAAR